RLLTPAARALAIAHEEDIVHRDVKPSNLFLARTRHDRMLKVLDFGIARLMHETQSRGASAGAPEALHAFTPQYAAPEQFSAQFGQAGPWTDVFALALVLIEIASGRPALEGDDLLKLYVASADERMRPSLARRGVVIPDAAEQVLQRALEV